MKVFVLFLLSFFLLACGVETNSSSLHNSETGDTNSSTDTGDNDENGGDNDNNDGSTGSGGTTVVVDGSSNGFDKVDAINDANACIINGTFQVINDSSYDPNAVADSLNGLELASQYPFSSDLEATKVALFYPSLSLPLLNEVVHVYEDNYRLSFDKAWSSATLPSVYIRTPKSSTGFYSCYRYDLDSLSGSTIVKTKVYR